MSTEHKNFSNEQVHLNFNLPQIQPISQDKNEHASFNTIEKKDKLKFNDHFFDIKNSLGHHSIIRSDTSNNVSFTETGRTKRKCVIESERRKLYLADLDSPPYFQPDEEPPIKVPRVKGRRGRPPKLGPDGFPLRRFPDMERVEMYYQSSIFDGFSYCFSTALANLSCRLVSEGHFKNVIDHHKSINFPHNIISQEVVANYISHYKSVPTSQINRFPTNMFNQPGPHMYRPHMNTHINQSSHLYQNIMHPQQMQNLHPHNNMNMISNYDYGNFYQMGGNNNRRVPTPNQMLRAPQNVSQPMYTQVQSQNHQQNIAYTMPQSTTINSNMNSNMNSNNNMSNNNINIVQRMSSTTPTNIRNIENSTVNTSSQSNTTSGMWVPNNMVRQNQTFPIAAEKLQLNMGQSANTVQGQYKSNVAKSEGSTLEMTPMNKNESSEDVNVPLKHSPKREL